MSASAENSNVQVVIRLRPPEDPAENVEDTFSFEADKPHVLTIKDPLSKGRSDHTFMFSRILQPSCDQTSAFSSVVHAKRLILVVKSNAECLACNAVKKIAVATAWSAP